MGSYLRPVELDEALAALAARPRVVLAGGTDYYPARVSRPVDDDVLDITWLSSLRAIARRAESPVISRISSSTERPTRDG